MDYNNYKVKAWSESRKKMIDLYKITPFALNENTNQDGIFIPFMEDLTLLRPSEVKDMAGRTYYEGDIVAYEGLIIHTMSDPIDIIFEVIFVRASFVLHSDKLCISMPLDSKPLSGKIIGNIYENPELRNNT